MGFQLPPHYEGRILVDNADRERFSRFAQSWAGDPRVAVETATRAGIVGATLPEQAKALIAADGLDLTDDQINYAMAQGMAVIESNFRTAAQMWSQNADRRAQIEANDSTQNEQWDLRFTPGGFATEALQAFQRTPGAWLSENTPLGSAPVRGTSRVFMLAADAAVDVWTDRLWRAGTEAFAQHGWSPLNTWDRVDEFLDEYLGGVYGGSEDDIIGTKPFWGMLGELSEGRRVNLSTGYIPNSELSASAQESLESGAQDVAQYAQGQEAAWERDAEGWLEGAMYATPYSQSLWYEGQRMLQAREEMLAAPGQAALGKPLTQAYDLQAEGFIKPIQWGVAGPDGAGRQHLSRVSGGRIMAALLAEPGSRESHYISGFGDFAKQVGLDPLNLAGAGAVGKITRSSRQIGMTEAGVEAARRLTTTDQAVAGLRSITDTRGIGWSREASALREAGTEFGPDLINQIRSAPTQADAVNVVRRTWAGDPATEARTVREAVEGLRGAPEGGLGWRSEVRELEGVGVNFNEVPELIEQIRRAPDAEEAIVLTNRARNTVDPVKANRYLTGGQAQPVVDALTQATKMRQVDAILSGVRGRIPARLRRELVEAGSEAEVIDILLPYLDSGLKLQGNLSTWGELASAGSMSEFLLGQGIARSPRQATRLVASTPYAIIDNLVESGLDSMHRLRTGMPGGTTPEFMSDLTMRARMRYQYGNTWAGRMVNDMSNAGIDPDDIDKTYVQVEDLARNGGIDTDDIMVRTNQGNYHTVKSLDEVKLAADEKIVETIDMDDIMRELAGLAPHDGAGVANVVKRTMDAVGMSMRQQGIDERFIRQVTRLWEETVDDRLYFVNSVGETVDYPGTGFSALVDGEIAPMPGPQLLNEFHHGVINVPDPRLLRRTLAEGNVWGRTMNRVTTQKGRKLPDIDWLREQRRLAADDGATGLGFFEDFKVKNWDDYGANLADRAAIRYARTLVNNVWKPAKLLRLGYPIKIILGDEQARMAAIGLSNFWAPWRSGDNPLSYFAVVLGNRKLVQRILGDTNIDVLDKPMRIASEYQDTVKLKGNGFGETGAMRSDSWRTVARGSDEYLDGLATELAQLIDDPLVGRLFDPELGGIDNLKAWFLSNDPDAVQLLDTYYQAVRRTNPIIADDFRQGGNAMDNYLQGLEARAHLKSGGDYVVVDPNTGEVLDSAGVVVGRAGEGEWSNLVEGYRITRSGDGDLLGAMSSKTLDDVRVTGKNTAGYRNLQRAVRKRLDANTEAFPQAVKYTTPSGVWAENPGMVSQLVDRMMEWVVAKPAENFSRSPTYTQLYWRQIGSYLPDMSDEAAEVILARARKAKMDKTVRTAARRAGKGTGARIELDELESIDMYAKSMAAEGTVDLLFDFARRKNSLDALNLIFPFGDAFLEAIVSYGRIFANDPLLLRRPLKAVDELRKSNPTEWGMDEFNSEQGFFHPNEFGEEVFTLPFNISSLPLVGDAGLDMQFDIPVGSLNMVANQFYPGVGPVVTIPAASVLPDTPAWQGIRELIAPFGISDSSIEEFVSETFGASPALNRILAGFTQGKFPGGEQERVFNQTVGWILREMMASGDYTPEELADPDVKEQIRAEATDRAQSMYFIRAALQAVLPAAPTAPTLFPTIEDDDPARYTKLAMQDASMTFYDIWNNETDQDWEAAQQLFHDRYGYDSVPFLVSFYESNARAGVTYEAWKTERTFPEVYDNLPRTAYYLSPDDPDDPFYYKAWTEQFTGGKRELKTSEEWIDDYIFRVAASQYTQKTEEAAAMVESGELAPPAGIDEEDYLEIINDEIKKDLIRRMPGYAGRVDTFTNRDRQEQIAELREWASYDRLANDPTVKAVGDFFVEWDQALEAQVNAGYGSKQAKVLPFTRAGVVRIKKDGTISDSWAVRSAINAELIAVGDRIAARPGSGNFDRVWEDVIKPTIYDYRGDVPTEEVEDPIDQLVDQLMGG